MRFSLSICCALLAVSPALAQTPQWFPRSEDRGPFEGQFFLGRASLRSIEITPPSGFLKVDAPNQNLWGGRLAWDVLRWGPGVVQASGGLAYGSHSSLHYTNSTGASGEMGADLHVRHQWMGGLLYLVEGPHFRPGFGLDLRRDALMVKTVPDLRSYGWINRLWLRGVAQYYFAPTGGMVPFMAMEVAVPVSHYQPSGVGYIGDLDHLGLPSNGDQGVAARTHAPRLQYSVSLGMRFGASQPRPVVTAQAPSAPEPLLPLAPKTWPSAPEVPVHPVPVKRTMGMTLPKVIVLDEAALHFALDRAEISEDGRAVLATWAARILTVSPQPRLKITGHSDATGSKAHNLDLSRRRAQAVAETLRSHGLSIVVGDVTGRGSSDPLASNQIEEGRARNRRVEIHLEGFQDGQEKGRVESTPQLEKPKASHKTADIPKKKPNEKRSK